MAPTDAAEALGGHLEKRNYSALIKQLDGALLEEEGGARLQLLLNRGFCLQQLGLFRKALKVVACCCKCGVIRGSHELWRYLELAFRPICRVSIPICRRPCWAPAHAAAHVPLPAAPLREEREARPQAPPCLFILLLLLCHPFSRSRTTMPCWMCSLGTPWRCCSAPRCWWP